MTALALKAWNKLWSVRRIAGDFGGAEAFYRYVITTLGRLILRPTYIGFENIPKTGPVILVSNHVSYLDGLIISAGCPERPIRYIIDGDIYEWPVVHYFMKLARAIPIMPNRASVTKALDEISAGLKAGDAVCLFPEGQLTFTGSLGRFKPGIEWILRRDSEVPVVPIALSGLWGSAFSRKYRKTRFPYLPRLQRREIVAVCGAPIPADQVSVNSLQREVLRLKYAHSYVNF